MRKIEAQRIKIGQKIMGTSVTVTAIRKLLMFGKSVVILKCNDGREYTVDANQKMTVSA